MHQSCTACRVFSDKEKEERREDRSSIYTLLSLQDFLGLLQLDQFLLLFGEVRAHPGDFLFLLADLL
jgi:hypothetical protein